MSSKSALCAALAPSLCACGFGLFDSNQSVTRSPVVQEDAGIADAGWFLGPEPVPLDVITYNIAGLPQGLSAISNPASNIARISPLINVYDVHMDAGHASPDERAHTKNFQQLTARILAASKQRAVLVMGDFNERYRDPGTNMEQLLAHHLPVSAQLTLTPKAYSQAQIASP